ncbi:MAG: Asp-tRNA(Asn)/Glu-tRNA(Gln) amidotransferase subunit GatC [Anaerolineales bacterium]|jgi:aspartyl-tRNA(Asn)/glutamyl-tRNA(Gln) amidotransferase subunit C
MALTIEEVEHFATLARLTLTDEEKTRYQGQLSAILDYFAQLRSLNTDDIPPTSSVLPTHSVLRPDKVRPGLSQEALLGNAPDVEADQFRVPPVFD